MADTKETKKKTEGATDTGVPVPKVHTLNREKRESKWSLERCMKFAKRFDTVEQWAKGTPSCYKAAVAHGWDIQCIAAIKSKGKSQTKVTKQPLKKSA